MGHSDGWLEGADSEDDSSLPRPSPHLAAPDFGQSAEVYVPRSQGPSARYSRRPSASTATSGAASGLTDVEASRLVRRAEKYKKRCDTLQKQLEETRANARAAALEVGRAEERASEASGRVESAAERQRQAEAECQSLRQALEKRGLELRELRYRNLHLARELAQTKEAASESERTAREGMRAVRGSLADAERALLTRTKGLRAEHRTLQSLVEALERHTQRGMHVGPTATAQQLIGDMWRSLSGMARAVDSVGRAVTGITPAADTSRRRRARPEEGEGGSGDVTGGYAEGERQLLAETMSDICGDLEAENRQMRAELEVLREQVAEAHRRAEAASLVPQYRLAVVRSRAQAAALRQRTADQERLMDALRDRVADLEERLREETGRRMEAVQERGERLRRVAKEQEAYRATFASVGQSFPPHRGRSASGDGHRSKRGAKVPLVPESDPGWRYWPRPAASGESRWRSGGVEGVVGADVAEGGLPRRSRRSSDDGARSGGNGAPGAASERRPHQHQRHQHQQEGATPGGAVEETVEAWVQGSDLDAPGVTQLDRMLLLPAEDAGAEVKAPPKPQQQQQQQQHRHEEEEDEKEEDAEERAVDEEHYQSRRQQHRRQPQRPRRRGRREKQPVRKGHPEAVPPVGEGPLHEYLEEEEEEEEEASGPGPEGDEGPLRARPPAGVLHAGPVRPLLEQEASAVLSPAAVGRSGSGTSSSRSSGDNSVGGSGRGRGYAQGGSGPSSRERTSALGATPAQAWAAAPPVTVPSPPASSSASAATAATDAGSVALRSDLARLDGEIIALQQSLRATTAQLSQPDIER